MKTHMILNYHVLPFLTSAILSFLAAFFLVRFRLREASRQEHKAEQSDKNGKDRKDGKASDDDHKESKTPPAGGNPSPIFSSNPQLEQVGPFRRGQPPTNLLEACHTLCMLLSVLGFIMAMVGVLCYTWAMLPRSSGILSSACIGFCVIAAVAAIFMPQSMSLFAPVHVVEPS
jgi:hypothetical protein